MCSPLSKSSSPGPGCSRRKNHLGIPVLCYLTTSWAFESNQENIYQIFVVDSEAQVNENEILQYTTFQRKREPMFPPGRAEPWNLPTTHWITLCTKRRRAHLDPLKCFRVDADGPVWKGASKQPFFPPTWYENVQYIRNLSAEHGSQDSLNLCCRFLVRLLLNAAGLVVGNRHHDYVATGVFSLKVLISHAIQSTDFNWLSLQLAESSEHSPGIPRTSRWVKVELKSNRYNKHFSMIYSTGSKFEIEEQVGMFHNHDQVI